MNNPLLFDSNPILEDFFIYPTSTLWAKYISAREMGDKRASPDNFRAERRKIRTKESLTGERSLVASRRRRPAALLSNFSNCAIITVSRAERWWGRRRWRRGGISAVGHPGDLLARCYLASSSSSLAVLPVRVPRKFDHIRWPLATLAQ